MARPLKKSIFSPYAAYCNRSNKEKKIKKSSSTKSLSELYKRKKSTKRSIKNYNKLKKVQSRAKSTYVGLSKIDGQDNKRNIKLKFGAEFLRLPRINSKITNNNSNIPNKNIISTSYLIKHQNSNNSLYLSESSSSTSSYSGDMKNPKNTKETENYQVDIDNGDLIEKIARESSFFELITDTKTRLEKIKINNY
jgi:hypothetical protein